MGHWVLGTVLAMSYDSSIACVRVFVARVSLLGARPVRRACGPVRLHNTHTTHVHVVRYRDTAGRTEHRCTPKQTQPERLPRDSGGVHEHILERAGARAAGAQSVQSVRVLSPGCVTCRSAAARGVVAMCVRIIQSSTIIMHSHAHAHAV